MSNQAYNTQTNTPANPLVVFEQQVLSRKDEFYASLPSHITPERFARVILTAVAMNPKLLNADRQSLWTAAMRAAADGLMPDGREGALVTYSTKTKDGWTDRVSWMPMIAGLRKKARNSGDIKTWDVATVHARDKFEYELGDEPFIRHAPYIGDDPGPAIAYYSVAVLNGGYKSRDIMSRAEVEHVRDLYSKKDRDGSFSQAWVKSFDEMARKTVARRHSKVLPMSTDLEDLLTRDDDLYEVNGNSERRPVVPRRTLNDRLDALIDDTPTDTSSDAISASETAAEVPASSVEGAEAKAVLPPSGPASAPDHRTTLEKAVDEHPEAVAAAFPLALRTKLDFLKRGAQIAAKGLADLDRWLDMLDGEESRLLTPELSRAWTDIAKAADKERGR